MGTNSEKFLEHFRELETFLVANCQINEDYVSYSKALNNIYSRQLNPIITQRNNYEFLKSAGDLRNILSHRNDVCDPTDAFLTKFINLKKRIIYPYTCYDLANKNVVSLHLEDSIRNAILLLDEYKLSHLPILESNRVVGVFSRTTLFDILNKQNNINSNLRMKEIKEFTSLEGHSNEYFKFVSRNTTLYDVFKMLPKADRHTKRLAVIFVTTDGNSDSQLIGTITETDLLSKLH